MENIVILGAGYGSLACIKKLNADFFQKAKVTLISEKPYHYLSILLHEVVSGVKDGSAKFDLKDILPQGVHFVQQTVKEITAEGVVCATGQTYPYDKLIVGLGFQSDTFGIEGIKEYATPLVNYEGALALKEKIFAKIRNYKTSQDRRDLKIVVCGGGFSGIELIASLAQSLKTFCAQEQIDSSLLSLTCVEAMPNILPMFPSGLVEKGVVYLKGLGVELATGCKILRCLENGVVVQRGEQEETIEAGVIIWTAGVKGNAVIENSPFFTSKRSKVEVNGFLQPIGQENQDKMGNIYVIGDCAAFKDPSSGRFYPPTAQIANKQGEYLAQALQARLNNESIQEFSYTTEGTMCSLGEKYAIGLMGDNKEASGLFAIAIKRIVESKWRFKLQGLSGVLKAD